MKNISILFLVAISFSSCIKKPTACLELEDIYEVGREYQFKSCSENYEFLTWDFQEQTGFVGDEATHRFYTTNSNQRIITLTAYGKGGYRSDKFTQQIKLATRYVDYIEITCDKNYTTYTFKFNSNEINFDNPNGASTEATPFVGNVYDQMLLKLPPDNSVNLQVLGSKTSLIKKTINFATNTENPILLTDSVNFIAKVYWKYE